MEKKKKNTCLSLTYPHVHIHPLYTHPYIKKKKNQEHAGIWCSHRELSKPITIQSIHSQCKLFLKTILAQNVFIYVNCVWIDFSVGLLFCSIRRVLHASTSCFKCIFPIWWPVCVQVCGRVAMEKDRRKSGERFLEKIFFRTVRKWVIDMCDDAI